MRIIGGRFRGRTLAPVPRRGVRPTADPVREALFNILGPAVAGRPFVDLCAGTGAVGLEALSRGAVPVVLVERSRGALRTIEANALRLGGGSIPGELTIVRADALRWVERGGGALTEATVFLDPPYGDRSTVRLAAAVVDSGLLGGGGLLVVEHAAAGPPPLPDPLWRRVYGDTALAAYGGRAGDPAPIDRSSR